MIELLVVIAIIGPFWAILRMYRPTAKALTGDGYAPPAIERSAN